MTSPIYRIACCGFTFFSVSKDEFKMMAPSRRRTSDPPKAQQSVPRSAQAQTNLAVNEPQANRTNTVLREFDERQCSLTSTTRPRMTFRSIITDEDWSSSNEDGDDEEESPHPALPPQWPLRKSSLAYKESTLKPIRSSSPHEPLRAVSGPSSGPQKRSSPESEHASSSFTPSSQPPQRVSLPIKRSSPPQKYTSPPFKHLSPRLKRSSPPPTHLGISSEQTDLSSTLSDPVLKHANPSSEHSSASSTPSRPRPKYFSLPFEYLSHRPKRLSPPSTLPGISSEHSQLPSTLSDPAPRHSGPPSELSSGISTLPHPRPKNFSLPFEHLSLRPKRPDPPSKHLSVVLREPSRVSVYHDASEEQRFLFETTGPADTLSGDQMREAEDVVIGEAVAVRFVDWQRTSDRGVESVEGGAERSTARE